MRALFSPMLLTAIVACGPDVTVKMAENLPPDSVINSPTHETVFAEGDVIQFVGTVADPGGLDDIQTVSWTSSIDFELGTAELSSPDSEGKTRVSTVLSPGTHVITLGVVDLGGLAGTDSVTVTVSAAKQEPAAEILSPDNFASYYISDEVNFTAVVEDEQDANGDLSVSWTAENTDTGFFETIGEGAAADNGSVELDWVPDEEGNYVITLTVEDSDKNTGFAEIYIVVTDIGDEDLDGDGWTPNTGDCDDDNDAVNPGMTEICADNLDNDCNGTIDDKDVDLDGHIDENCVNYTGLLPRDDCDDESFNTHPGSTEIVDGEDNDCDGEIDDGTDAYDNDGDCYCVTAPCMGSISSACGTINGGDCDDADSDVHPGADDEPDLDYVDQDCDGLDGALGGGIYVDPVSGKDSQNGTSSSRAVKTLDEAFSKAKSSGRDWIYVASGDMSLSGSFQEGINIAGGYDATSSWTRKSAIVPTLFVSASGVTISNWKTATEWQQIGIISDANTSASGSSFALKIINSKDLLLNGCEIESGDAGHGNDGSKGGAGPNGSSGVRGDNGVEDSSGLCDSNPNPTGGSAGGGGSTCSTSDGGSGGNPGHGGGSGKSGGTAPMSGGVGGAGGAGGKDGSVGKNGSNGSKGSNGTGGASYGSWSSSGYTVSHGKNGGAGDAGAGGGGGGGGGGGDDWCDSWGGGGGGGGGAGCGGKAGTGGSGGGSSVAILLSGSNITLKYTSVLTGNGGDGGDAGEGGSGGNGGNGGAGGKHEDDSGKGAGGGSGGDGGDGGNGGGGGGGPTIGIVCTSSSTAAVDSHTTYTLGNGGNGGTSKSASGQTGRRADDLGC